MRELFFKKRQIRSTLSEINMTPLIDLAFALLIIFMVTTPLLEQRISVDLPTESPNASLFSQDSFHTIVINNKGRYFFDNEPISLKRLNKKLAHLETLSSTIDIRADKHLPYQKVIDLIDILKQNKLTKISLNTTVKQ